MGMKLSWDEDVQKTGKLEIPLSNHRAPYEAEVKRSTANEEAKIPKKELSFVNLDYGGPIPVHPCSPHPGYAGRHKPSRAQIWPWISRSFQDQGVLGQLWGQQRQVQVSGKPR